jgi:hypothetical protein
MFSIDLFLTNYGSTTAFTNCFKFAKNHKEQLIEVIRIDKFNPGSGTGQILENHIFYLIFANSNSLGRLFVLGCGATSGYSGSGPADFKALMDWLTTNEMGISYYSVHFYEEHLQFWGSEPNKYGDSVPSANGTHRQHGPSPWDYGDKFVQQTGGISLEEYKKLGREAYATSTQQELYSCTLEFLLKDLESGDFLQFL